MANKSTGTIVVVVSSLAVITFLGILLMRKAKAGIPKAANNPIFDAGQIAGNAIANTPITLGSLTGGSVPFTLYAIQTSGSNLNVRDKPTTNGKLIKTLEPFISVYGRPSVKGWMEVSEDGKTVIGYASSDYLRKL